MSLEDGDLDMRVRFGLIAYGRLGDILKLRMRIRELIERDCQDLKIVYHTITADKIWIRKEVGEREQG
jgi:hypothetical protein